MSLQSARSHFTDIVSRVLESYGSIWTYSRRFVGGKLTYDPVYEWLMRDTSWIPQDGLLLDIGCGRGILLCALEMARRSGALNIPGLSLMGVEARTAEARVAQKALVDSARIVCGDIRSFDLPACTAVILLDVLLYLNPVEQMELLDRVARCIQPGGVLLIREANATTGWRFRMTAWAERLCAWGRFDFRQRYHYRSMDEWRTALESRGFRVKTESMSSGTPFANVLFLSHKM